MMLYVKHAKIKLVIVTKTQNIHELTLMLASLCPQLYSMAKEGNIHKKIVIDAVIKEIIFRESASFAIT